jgi:hypothetical protein
MRSVLYREELGFGIANSSFYPFFLAAVLGQNPLSQQGRRNFGFFSRLRRVS